MKKKGLLNKKPISKTMKSNTYERDNSISLLEQIGRIRRNIQLRKELYPIEIINTVEDQLPVYYETENGYFEEWIYDGAGNPIGYNDWFDQEEYNGEMCEEYNDIVNKNFWELMDTAPQPRLNLIDETMEAGAVIPDIVIYLIDQTKAGCEICIGLTDEDFIAISTTQKLAYSLDEFQRAVNNYTITNLNDYVMRII